MSRLFLTPFLATGLTLSVLSLGACFKGSDEQDKSGKATPDAPVVEVSEAWCRPTPNGAQTGACYLTLKAEGASETLTSVASPAAMAVSIHRSSPQDGTMSMEPLEAGLRLPVGQTVTLAPGGNHIMLMNLTRPLVAGEVVSLTLGFQSIAAQTVQAEVRLPQVESGNGRAAKK